MELTQEKVTAFNVELDALLKKHGLTIGAQVQVSPVVEEVKEEVEEVLEVPEEEVDDKELEVEEIKENEGK